MKASIITMTNTYNYGATLQAYALHKFIQSNGYECDIIDHMSAEKKHRKVKLFVPTRANLYLLPYKFSLERGYRSFEDFYEKHMNMTCRYPTIESLKAHLPDSDVFISGSDQVWNHKDPKLDRFLLDFVPDKNCKVSYAASMGNSDLPEEKKAKFSKGLERFDAISVREQEVVELLQPLTNKKVNVHCDPAFLLTAEEWRTIEKPVKGVVPGKYILCYMLHLPVWFNEWAKKLRKETGLPIVFVGLNGYRPVIYDKYVRNAGPGEFLWLIDNAAMVVSSSFHGNVFSLIFGKKLISTPDKNRPDRIHNLLRMFNENRRELYDSETKWISENVNGEGVELLAQEERERTREFFKNVFDNIQ